MLLGNCLNSHRELREKWSHHPQSFIDTQLYTHGTFEALIERRKCPPTPETEITKDGLNHLLEKDRPKGFCGKKHLGQ